MTHEQRIMYYYMFESADHDHSFFLFSLNFIFRWFIWINKKNAFSPAITFLCHLFRFTPFSFSLEFRLLPSRKQLWLISIRPWSSPCSRPPLPVTSITGHFPLQTAESTFFFFLWLFSFLQFSFFQFYFHLALFCRFTLVLLFCVTFGADKNKDRSSWIVFAFALPKTMQFILIYNLLSFLFVFRLFRFRSSHLRSLVDPKLAI